MERDATIEIAIDAMAHGGEGIGRADDGRVVFVAGALPGDRVRATVTMAKKRWARASLTDVTTPSPHRVDVACPAAALGAGCCDYSHVAPGAQLGLKRQVLLGQLGAFARRSGVFAGWDPDTELDARTLAPATGWRTRVRLGVDGDGRAGMRRARSTDLVTSVACTQVAPSLLDGIVGSAARRFTPGAEVVAVLDGEGRRHVVETTRARRGGRVERIDTVVEGTGTVTENVNGRTFTFPATAFWQAHSAAPETYSDIVAAWGAGAYNRRVGWDLYGGVGLFAPEIAAALGEATVHVDIVDYSPAAAAAEQPALAGLDVARHNQRVEGGIDVLPAPGLVVLDPPRSGAGVDVVKAIAAASPERVIHVGCDPATFSRDLAAWGNGGYRVKRMELLDAFPATHHFEVVALLEPCPDTACTPRTL